MSLLRYPSSFISLRFLTVFFYGVGLASQPPTQRTRVSLFVWVITLDLSGMEGPTSSICYSQHSSQDHVTVQVPPLRQSRDTFGGNYHSTPRNIPEERRFQIYEMDWACGTYGWGEGVYRVLVGKPEGRRPMGRPRRRWVDNIRMDLQEVGIWTGLGWPRIETGGGRF